MAYLLDTCAASELSKESPNPRAATADLRELRPSDPDDDTLPTLVRQGASIGAHATIGCGLTIHPADGI